MNHIWSKVCAASVAAAGVMVATSAASAESRPLQFETEFDLGLDRVAEAVAPAAVAPEVSPAGWEAAIGSYLDALVARAEASPAVDATTSAAAAAVAAATEAASAEADAVTSDLLVALGLEPAGDIAEEPAAKAEASPAEAAPAAATAEAAPNPLLLAPVLSHPAHCESCTAALHDGRKEVEQAAAAAPAAVPAAAPADVRVDDFAAWQKLADWAAARAEADADDAGADDQAATAESDFFFDVFAEEDSATE